MATAIQHGRRTQVLGLGTMKDAKAARAAVEWWVVASWLHHCSYNLRTRSCPMISDGKSVVVADISDVGCRLLGVVCRVVRGRRVGVRHVLSAL